MLLHRQQITIVAPQKLEPEAITNALKVIGVVATNFNNSVLVDVPDSSPEDALYAPSRDEISKAELAALRQEAAEAAFEAYLMVTGDLENYVDSGGWAKKMSSYPELSNSLWKKVYFVREDNEDSKRKTFSIEFQQNSAIIIP